MSKDSQSKSSESVDAILKQIKEFTENDTFSTSSTPLEDPKRLIEDITITSSMSDNNALSVDFSNDDSKISSEEIDPDLQYYLSKMSQMSGHDIDNLSDAAREFQSMKFDSDSHNDDIQIDTNEYLNLFNDRLNVETSSLDDVMNMVELMQNEKIQGNFIQPPMSQIDYFPNDEDILIGKNEFLSDDFSINERERKINDIISKQNQRNKSSLRKSQQKLLSKTYSTNADDTVKTIPDNQNDTGSSNSIKFHKEKKDSISTSEPPEEFDEIKKNPIQIMNQSFNNKKNEFNDLIEEEEEDIDNEIENKESSTKQISNKSFSNSDSKRETKSSSKSASFNQIQSDPIQNKSTSASPTTSTPISTPNSFSNKSNKVQISNLDLQNQYLSKSSIRKPESRRNNEEETEEDIFSFSSKGKVNSNDNNNDLDEEIKKNNQSISQLMTSSFKSSSTKNNKNNNSFLSNKNDKEDVVDIIKNVNEELERNEIDQNIPNVIDIEEEKINLSRQSQNIAPTNANTNRPNIDSNSNSYSYSPHISNRSRKGIGSNSRTNKISAIQGNSNSLNNVFTNISNNINNKNNSYNPDAFLNDDGSNNSEDMNIFDFDDNSSSNNNLNNRSYAGHHVTSKPNLRPATSSSSYLRDSQKSRNQQRSYVNNTNNNTNSSRRQQLTEIDFENAELTKTNRKLIEENELLKQKISDLETENEQLKYSSVTSNEKASSLEHENERLSSQLSLQEVQLENLKSSKEKVQKAYNEIEDLLSNQTNEAQKLAKQREQLLSMLQKQTKICERYEELLDDAQKLSSSMKQNSAMNNDAQSSNSVSSSTYSYPNQQNANFFNNNSSNFPPNQNQNQFQMPDPNLNLNQQQQQQMFIPQNYQPYQNFNPNPDFNPNSNFNQNQNFTQNQNFNPNSSFNPNSNFNQIQNMNQNSMVYKNELIQPKVPDFTDLLSQICQSVSDIFGIDIEEAKRSSSSNNSNSNNNCEDEDEDDSSLKSVLNEIIQLKDAANIPPNSRIANIVSFLTCRVKDDNESLHTSKTKRSILRKQVSDSQNRELQVLQILEGELRFLQHLAHSTDIQNVVFYRPSIGKSLSLNKEAHSELMRHCVSVQKFIDDSIGFYSKDQLTTIANGIFSNDNRNSGKFKKSSEIEKNTVERVFNLFHTDDFEKGIQYMLSFVSSRILNETDNNDANASFLEKISNNNKADFGDVMNYRQVADLFFAQSIMNEILQNHIIDLQSQVVYANHQNQKLQIELRDQDDTKAALEYATKEMRHYQKKDEKLFKLISRALEIRQEMNEKTENNEGEVNDNDRDDILRKSRVNKSSKKRSNSVNNYKRSSLSSSSQISESNSDSLSEASCPPKIRPRGRSSSVQQQESRNGRKRGKKSDKDTTAMVTTLIKRYFDVNQQLIEKESELKNLVSGIEKVQANYKKKVDKRGKVIRDLKKVVNSQSNEIESLKNESAKRQQKCTDDFKLKEMKLGSLKAVLQGIQNLRDDLKTMVVRIYKEHQNQIQHLRADWNNMLTNYEHSFESSSRTRESLALLEQERDVLRNRIVSDQKSFKRTINALQKKAQSFRVQYESLTADVRSLRAENERLASEHQGALTAVEHMKAELDALRTEKKALEVKMKAGEERFDCERKTLSSQLQAKVMSLQADVSSQLKSEQEGRMQELQQIVLIASPYLNKLNETAFNSPLNVVKALCSVINEVVESHKKAVAEASDAASARALLSLSRGSPLCPAISNILRELREIRSKLEKVKKGEKENAFQLEQKMISMQTNQVNSNTGEWESWARRVIGGVSDTNVASMSVVNLRKLIEEAVLASVSQRRLIFMLRSLREEKKALIKFDKSILNSNTSLSLSSPSWGAIVAVYASIRRMQQLAGCMPIQMRQIPESGRISIVDEDNRRRARRGSSKGEIRRGRKNDLDDQFDEEFEGKNRSFSLRKKSGRSRRRNDYDDDYDPAYDNRSRNRRNVGHNDYEYAEESDDDYNQKKSRRKYK